MDKLLGVSINPLRLSLAGLFFGIAEASDPLSNDRGREKWRVGFLTI